MDEKDNEARPVNSTVSHATCFYPNCDLSPSWEVESLVEKKNPDGSLLSLLTCDDHYGTITSDLRKAGTRYVLHPLGEAAAQTSQGRPHIIFRLVVTALTVAVALVIGPFIIAYYGAKAAFGWRPPEEK